MSSGSSNYGCKRLTKTVDLTGRDAAELPFKISFDTEPEDDFVFVEARTVDGADKRAALIRNAMGYFGAGE